MAAEDQEAVTAATQALVAQGVHEDAAALQAAGTVLRELLTTRAEVVAQASDAFAAEPQPAEPAAPEATAPMVTPADLRQNGVPVAEWPQETVIHGLKTGDVRIDNEGQPRLAPTKDEEVEAAARAPGQGFTEEARHKLAQLEREAIANVTPSRDGKVLVEVDPRAVRQIIDLLNNFIDQEIKSHFDSVARLNRALNRTQLIAKGVMGMLAKSARMNHQGELSDTARDIVEQTAEDALAGRPIASTVATVATDQVINAVLDEVGNVAKHITPDAVAQMTQGVEGAIADAADAAETAALAQSLDPVSIPDTVPEIAYAPVSFSDIMAAPGARDENGDFDTAKYLDIARGIVGGDVWDAMTAAQRRWDALGPEVQTRVLEAVTGVVARTPKAVHAPEKTVEQMMAEVKPSPNDARLPDFTDKIINDFEGPVDDPSKDDPRSTIKKQFLDETSRYLKRVAKLLEARGFSPHMVEDKNRGRKSKGPQPQPTTWVNKAGPAVSGEVSLSMLHEGGTGVYVQIGQGAMSSLSKDGGLTVMVRRADKGDRFGSKDSNQFWSSRYTVAEMADRLERLALGSQTQDDRSPPEEPKQEATPQITLGSIERVSLPTLGLNGIEAKVDTGAQTSSLHATNIHTAGKKVAFTTKDGRIVSADLVDRREIRSSNGRLQTRYVVSVPIKIGSHEYPIEVTLTDRSAMQYQMLLGRQAIRDNMVVNPNKSFLAGTQSHVPGPEPEVVRIYRDKGETGLREWLDRDGMTRDELLAIAEEMDLTVIPRTRWRAIDVITLEAGKRIVEKEEADKASPVVIDEPVAADNTGAVTREPESIIDATAAAQSVTMSDVARRYAVTLEKIGTDGKAFYDIVSKLKTDETLKKADLDAIAATYAGASKPGKSKAQAIAAIEKAFLARSETEASAAVLAGDVSIITRDLEDRANDRRRAEREERDRLVVDGAQALPAGGISEGIRPDGEGGDAGSPPRRDGGAGRSDVQGFDQPDREQRPVVEQAVQPSGGEPEVRQGPGKRGGDARGDTGAAGQVRRLDIAEAVAKAKAEREERRTKNYRITDEDEIGKGGPKAKVRANLEAIRLVKKLEEEGRMATDEEKKILVRYVGWGAFAQEMFDTYKAELAKERQTLADLVSAEEYEAARASTQNAHYTSPEVIKAMWSAMRHFGFKGGKVIEPSAGIGHFIGLMPSDMAAKSDWTAVEMDKLTGAIAKHLYQGTDVRIEGFEKAAIPDGFFDVAISNVPFGNYTVTGDRKYNKLLIHDYFFVKSLDRVRPGGIVAFITSDGTLDKVSPTARRMMADRGEFMGAIRLPGGNKGAFASNAGTAVTTDIIFFRKKVGGMPDVYGHDFVNTSEFQTPEGPTQLNNYFIANPDMMLGQMRLLGTQWRRGDAMLVGSTDNLGAKIEEAAQKLPADIYLPRGFAVEEAGSAPRQLADDGIKEGAYYIKDGQLFQSVAGEAVPQKAKGDTLKRIKALIGIRDIVNDLLNGTASGNDQSSDHLRAKLNAAYDAFVKQYGPIGKEVRSIQNRTHKDGTPFEVTMIRRPNLTGFDDDPDVFKIAAIENYNPETDTATKRAIFASDILATYERPQIAGPSEALAVSLNETGRVDIERIAQMLGVSEAEAAHALGDQVYKDPSGETWTTAELYLSGDVVTKLDNARAAAKSDPDYQRNVTALEAVQPAQLTRIDIRTSFGSPWIPLAYYNEFFAKVIGVSGFEVKFEPISSSWIISRGSDSGYVPYAAQDTYGTSRVHVNKLIMAALNNRVIKIYNKQTDGSSVLDVKATEDAAVKVKMIADAFTGDTSSGIPGWIFEDDDRAQKIEAIYNAKFNRIVPTRYNGNHLSFPGMATQITRPNGEVKKFELEKHQKSVVWRIVQTGNTLMDHTVGAGKAQPLDAKILTPDGWKRMGDVSVGDMVIGRDGKPTRVLGVYPQGRKTIYRVEFSDGSSTECCDEHLWKTQTYAERSAESAERRLGKSWPSAKGKIRSLAEIRRSMIAPHLAAKNHSIPIVEPVAFNAKPVPLDPYLVGALIGDGCMRGSRTVSISSADAEVLERVRAALPAQCELRHMANYDYAIRYTGEVMFEEGVSSTGRMMRLRAVTHPVIIALEGLGLWGKLSYEKRVPGVYMFNSEQVRLSTLRGLMDTDGTVSNNGTRTEFTTTSPGLADDVSFLVRSFGGITKRREKTIVGCHTAITLAISMPPHINPFALTRKAALVVPKSKYVPKRYITAVVPVGEKLAQCIAVESHEHLYVTDDFIVTHNTFASIAAGMEMKRLGMIQRPMYVVPNHMLEQFSREFYQAYPNAKLLIADKSKMEAKNRKAFAARIAADQWDGIIIRHDSFGRLPMKREAYEEYIRREIDEIMDAWLEAKRAAGEPANIGDFNAVGARDSDGKLIKTKPSRDPTIKEIERKKRNLEAKLDKLLNSESKDTGVTFEELGVDFLFVDEAHLFKNLDYQSRHSNIKGLGVKGSQRATDMLLKIRHIEKSKPGRAAVFMTGTPMSRSMAEIFTMQRYLQWETLKEYGVERFDNWFATFGRPETKTETGLNGKLKDVTRANFINVPELYALYSRVADSVTAADLDLPRPGVEGKAPQMVLAQMDEGSAAEFDRLLKRVEQLRGPAVKGAENHLSLYTKMRQVATDMRLLDPSAPYNPEGKIAKAVANVAEIYKAGKRPALAQIIWLDMGVPGTRKAKSKDVELADAGDIEVEDENKIDAVRAALGGEEDGVDDADAEEEQEKKEIEALLAGRFDLYTEIKNRLVAAGIPADEIATIYDAKNDEQKAKLFKDVREGRKRILLGSSSKMGVGTNVQQYLIAAHHLDAPWNPADVVQRDGRIIRQGNLNKEVKIFRYVTERSADTLNWNILEAKANAEAAFRAGARGVREMDDIDSPLPEAAALKAAASGDPRLMEYAELTKQIRELEAAKRGHERVYLNAQRSLADTKAQIDAAAKALVNYEADSKLVTDLSGDNFRMTMDTRSLQGEAKERKVVGEAIRAEIISALGNHWGRQRISVDLGDLSGFKAYARAGRTDQGVVVSFGIEGAAQYESYDGDARLSETSDPVGIVSRLTNIVRNQPGLTKNTANKLEQLRSEIPRLEKIAHPTPFPRAVQLAAAKARHEELERQLRPQESQRSREEAITDEVPQDGGIRDVSSRGDLPAIATFGADKTPEQRAAGGYANLKAALKYERQLWHEGLSPDEIVSRIETRFGITRDEAEVIARERFVAGRKSFERVLAGMSTIEQAASSFDPSMLDNAPFVGEKEALYQEDMRRLALRQALAREIANAARRQGSPSGDGLGAVGASEGATQGPPAAPAATEGRGQRDEIGQRLGADVGFRAAAIDAFIAPELTADRIEARAVAQGFDTVGYHGTQAAFTAPNAFVPGADFGFHVGLGEPTAVNARLGMPTTFRDWIATKVAQWLAGVPAPSLENSNIIPLRLRVENPLRLPDIGVVGPYARWSNPVDVLRLMEHPLANVPEGLKRWVRNIVTTTAADPQQMLAAVRAHAFSKAFAVELERHGYDAIIYRNTTEAAGRDSMLVWNPAQVRSAFDFFHDDAAGAEGLRASDAYVEQDLADDLARLMAEEGMDQTAEATSFAEAAGDEAGALAEQVRAAKQGLPSDASAETLADLMGKVNDMSATERAALVSWLDDVATSEIAYGDEVERFCSTL